MSMPKTIILSFLLLCLLPPPAHADTDTAVGYRLSSSDIFDTYEPLENNADVKAKLGRILFLYRELGHSHVLDRPLGLALAWMSPSGEMYEFQIPENEFSQNSLKQRSDGRSLASGNAFSINVPHMLQAQLGSKVTIRTSGTDGENLTLEYQSPTFTLTTTVIYFKRAPSHTETLKRLVRTENYYACAYAPEKSVDITVYRKNSNTTEGLMIVRPHNAATQTGAWEIVEFTHYENKAGQDGFKVSSLYGNGMNYSQPHKYFAYNNTSSQVSTIITNNDSKLEIEPNPDKIYFKNRRLDNVPALGDIVEAKTQNLTIYQHASESNITYNSPVRYTQDNPTGTRAVAELYLQWRREQRYQYPKQDAFFEMLSAVATQAPDCKDYFTPSP